MVPTAPSLLAPSFGHFFIQRVIPQRLNVFRHRMIEPGVRCWRDQLYGFAETTKLDLARWHMGDKIIHPADVQNQLLILDRTRPQLNANPIAGTPIQLPKICAAAPHSECPIINFASCFLANAPIKFA